MSQIEMHNFLPQKHEITKLIQKINLLTIGEIQCFGDLVAFYFTKGKGF